MGVVGVYSGGGRSVRDWVVDSVLFAGSVAVGLALFFTNPDVDTAPEALLVIDLVTGSALCVALWWRRRWPVELAVVAALIGTFSGMSGGAGLVLLFSVIVHRRGPVVWAMAGLALVTAAPYEWLRGGGDDVSFGGGMAIALLLVLSVVAWGMFVRARRDLIASLRFRAVRAETEQQLRVEQARQTERTRIAREMHDVLAHRISLVSLHAGALEFHPDAPAADVARSAAVIRSSAHQALEDLREILGVLRLTPAEQGSGPGAEQRRPVPTLADVPRLIEESREAGMTVRCSTSVGDVAEVPAGAGRTAYRVVQEGLTNVHRHAAGTAARVSLSGGPGEGLTVEVRNDRSAGSPPDPADLVGPGIPGAGQGLTGLAERVEVAGGSLAHGPDGSGWSLRAWLPWTA